VGDRDDASDPSLTYRWVKANVYSALLNAILGFGTGALAKALAVTSPDTGTLALTAFVILMTLASALGFAVFALLTGGVLARKIPSFPMRNWIVAHVVGGSAVGLLFSALATIPEEALAEPPEIGIIVFVTMLYMFAGGCLGGLFGLLQAFVLRKVADGLPTWIGFSFAAGMTFGILVLGYFLEPTPGLVRDLVAQAATFVVGVVTGLVMLPAVAWLQPREPANSGFGGAAP
jgi:MFS family permease